MKIENRTLLICNCEGTMALDPKALAKAFGAKQAPDIHSHLCRAGIEDYQKALGDGEPLLVACTQEAPLFRELAEESGNAGLLSFTNIRERAGWCDKGNASAKIAALLAVACLDSTPAGQMTLQSDGMCLVYGAGQAALDVARKLSGRLDVTLLLSDASDIIPPSIGEISIYSGEITAASGHFGNFEIVVDKYAPLVPSSKASLDFMMARDGAASKCALIFDMSGGTPLLSAYEKRDGYFHVDPNHAPGISEAMFEISDLVGEFEKPLYVNYNRDVCAHSRSGITGCSKCLDLCPASAITPDEDGVLFDPAICGGCGSCHSVCPTGAVSYDYPNRADIITRAQTLAAMYLKAGGKRPVLLLHDEHHGSELISALARFGRGLPPHVLPLSVHEITLGGHDLFAPVLSAGFEQIVLLGTERKRQDYTGLEAQIELMNTIMSALGHKGGPRIQLLAEDDPDKFETALYGLEKLKALPADPALPVGDKRTIARAGLAKLNETAPKPQEQIALPDGAPYGRIQINADGCTLCLACVSSCPANALLDNPDKPQVRFVEQACVQCGICKTACPESVITLEPRFDFTPAALSPAILNEEEPFNCIRCDKPFGTKSTVERIMAQLAGKHSMFAEGDSAKLIQMCDDCRIQTHAESDHNPLAGGPRPQVRTTEDYLEAEEAASQSGNGLTANDFLMDDD